MVRSCLAARLSRRVGSVLRPFSGRFRSVVSLAPALPSGPPRSAEPLVPGFWQVSMRTKQERGGAGVSIYSDGVRRCGGAGALLVAAGSRDIEQIGATHDKATPEAMARRRVEPGR